MAGHVGIASLDVDRYWPIAFALVGVLLRIESAHADDDAIARYRKSWNPFTGGPQLVSSADLHPQGQFFVRPFIYSEFGYAKFGDAWSVNRQSLPQRLNSFNPQVELDYGITDSDRGRRVRIGGLMVATFRQRNRRQAKAMALATRRSS